MYIIPTAQITRLLGLVRVYYIYIIPTAQITRLLGLVRVYCIYIYNPNCSDHQAIGISEGLLYIYIYNPNCSDHQAIGISEGLLYIYIIPTAQITRLLGLVRVYYIYI